MFCNMNFDDYGTDDESTLTRRRPKNSESLDLNAKFGKREIGESLISCCNPLLILLMLIVKTKLLPNILLMP